MSFSQTFFYLKRLQKIVVNIKLGTCYIISRLRLSDFEVSTKDGDGGEGEESSRDSSLDYQDDLKSIVQVYFESNNLETSYCRHCSAMFPLPNVRWAHNKNVLLNFLRLDLSEVEFILFSILLATGSDLKLKWFHVFPCQMFFHETICKWPKISLTKDLPLQALF